LSNSSILSGPSAFRIIITFPSLSYGYPRSTTAFTLTSFAGMRVFPGRGNFFGPAAVVSSLLAELTLLDREE
jgi:hypothetical protein